MKKHLFFRAKIFLILFLTVISAFSVNNYAFNGNLALAKENYDSKTVYLAGISAGFSLDLKGVLVVGITDVLTENGVVSPLKDKDIMPDDIIKSIDGKDINTADDLESAIADGKEKIIKITRKNKDFLITATPQKDVSDKMRLGLFIRENISGIGTITYINDKTFAALGHPVQSVNGGIFEISGGNLYKCSLSGIIRGEKGAPGELKGVINRSENLGEIYKNSPQGVYGKVSEEYYNDITKNFRKTEIGEGLVGKASIYLTLSDGNPKEYGISIVKAQPNGREDKNFVIKITDEELLSLTGGIIQGMSGSPILQDGKIIGAVTHVFVNDPKRGFGISIQNMLNNQ